MWIEEYKHYLKLLNSVKVNAHNYVLAIAMYVFASTRTIQLCLYYVNC